MIAFAHSRRRWVRRTSLVLVAALTVTLGGISFGAASGTAASTSGTTLTVDMDSSGIDTLNPFLSYYNASLDTFGMIYPSLTTLDSQGKAIPYLARSWSTSTDQKTWTFKIQDGLKWSDGKPLTAADAAWTLNLIMKNETAGTANGSLVSNFASVTALDATTLVITTKQPQANMLYVSIPVSGIPIVPQHIWQGHVGDLKTYKNTTFPVVGYGPWSLTNYVTDQYETFTANKSWSNGSQKGPKFDNLVVRLFKNSDAAVAALRSKQLDILSVTPTQFAALKTTKGLGTYRAGGNGWTAVEINAGAKTLSGKAFGTANTSLADANVRKAIHLAIDKTRLTNDVIRGQGVEGAGYLPPAWPQWFWSPSASEKVSFDISAANALLDKAGYTKGSDGIRIDPKTKKPLDFRFGIHSDSSSDAQISALMQGWLKQIGIQVKIEPMSMTMLNDNLSKGDWDILMDGWTTGPDPSYLLSIQTCAALPATTDGGGMTDSFFCDKEYDQLFEQQVTTLDPAKRQQIIARMQQILYAGNQDIILYYANTLGVYRQDAVTNVPVGKVGTAGTYPAQNVYSLYLSATPAATTSNSSGSSAGLWIGIVVAVVVLGGGAAWFALRRRSTAGDRE